MWPCTLFIRVQIYLFGHKTVPSVHTDWFIACIRGEEAGSTDINIPKA